MAEPPLPAVPAPAGYVLWLRERVDRVLLGLAALGALLLVITLRDDEMRALRQLGLFLLTYAAVVAASWLPPSRLGARVDAFLDSQLKRGFTGFYGVMAIATFVSLETVGLFDDITGFELSTGQFVRMAVNWIIGFSIDSVLNLVWASIWPVRLMQGGGWLAMLIAIGLAYAVYRIGSEVFPDVHRRLNPPRKKQSGKPAASDAAGN